MDEKTLVRHYANQGFFQTKEGLKQIVILDDALVDELLFAEQVLPPQVTKARSVQERIYQLLKIKPFAKRKELERLFKNPPSDNSFAVALLKVRKLAKAEGKRVEIQRGDYDTGARGDIYRLASFGADL